MTRERARPKERSPGGDAGRLRVLGTGYQLLELERARGRRLSRRAWQRWSWLLVLAAALAAFGLAAAFGDGSPGARLQDALHLFPSGFPSSEDDEPWQFTLAAYLAATVSIYVTLRVVLTILAERVTALRAGLRRSHVVVVGLGDKGLRAASAFLAADRAVTCVDTEVAGDAVEAARERGALVLRGDGAQVATLAAARAGRATAVVCACRDDATNARIATLAAGLATRVGSRRLDLYVHVSDPELAKLVRAAGAGLQHARLHFFNVHDVWAEELLSQPAGPFEPPGDVPPHAIVAGATPLGCALAVGAARRWHRHARRRALDAKARITLADRDAEAVCHRLAARYPALARVCELAPAPARPDFPALVEASPERPTAVYGCFDDRSANLALALEAEYDLGGRTPVFMPASAAAAELGGLIVRAGSIHAIPLPSGEDAFALLHDRLREPLARAVHDLYLESRRGSPDFGARPGDCPWSELPEELRQQSRDHADGIADQLRALWFEIAPLDDWDEDPVSLTPTAVEAMAELEHDRWCREKRAAGFRHGPERDDARKISDLLVPWSALSEADREYDRRPVRERPRLLHEIGYRLERSPARETLARAVHARYLETRRTAGDFGSLPADRGWEELAEEYRERSRSNVDGIAVKLARIGCQLAPLIGPDGGSTLSDGEALELARLEHDRWLAERTREGWAAGPRDDAAKTHPDLLAWEALPADARQKDVDLVREIPTLLAAAGYGIVRGAS